MPGQARTAEDFAHNGDQAERMVYVTVSGTVYHRNPGCRYLNVVVQQMSGAGVKSARNMYGENIMPVKAAAEIRSLQERFMFKKWKQVSQSVLLQRTEAYCQAGKAFGCP